MDFEQEVVISAPTVEEAVILGLARLGITREAAEIQVLDEGSKGFLGLGAREARVRVKALPPASVTPPPTPTMPVVEPAKAEVTPAPGPTPVSTLSTTPLPVVAEKTASVPATAKKPEKKSAPAAASKPKPQHATPAKPAASRSEISNPATAQPVPSAPVRTAATLPPAEREAIESVAREAAEHFFSALELQISLAWREDDPQALWISLRGKDADALVGPRAQTLDTIQYLLRTVVRHKVSGNYDLILDADGYRERRLRNLTLLAREAANKAVKQGRAVQLRPMPASDRRVIHMTLRDDTRVRTQSTGTGRARAVTVIPVDATVER